MVVKYVKVDYFCFDYSAHIISDVRLEDIYPIVGFHATFPRN